MQDMTKGFSSSSMPLIPALEMRCRRLNISLDSFKVSNCACCRSRYTASLTSSIENYPIENGRRYGVQWLI